MNKNTKNSNSKIPEEVLELVPWYTIGKLSVEDKAFFEKALTKYSGLSELLQEETQIVALTSADRSILNKSAIAPPEERLKAVFNMIDAAETEVQVKDATSDLNRPILTAAVCGQDFCQLSGEDGTAIPFNAGGGHGCISVTGNIAPKLCAQMQSAWFAGNIERAMELQSMLMPVHSAMFCETSPGPVKYAAELLGHGSAYARLPIWEIADSSKNEVEIALKGAGILS